jgi:hypothetical protein
VVPECDERRFINPILFENGIDPHFIQGNQHGPFRCLSSFMPTRINLRLVQTRP